ncbi:basic salivary proline-rich protein 4-like [Haemorhous mexicanus]|uniref:basic salivary proline-rich protein 4-like n=1 Tax=Haemorhous mexicanus TaxID=30427 RepID=UPI0028BDBFB3|nr:basic salivary proline-rich protein 4-like [Haemorhous mexicanus]XP_059693771.1 basic salivary proline-rich protein 4-like [Haemorhous mexicanus]
MERADRALLPRPRPRRGRALFSALSLASLRASPPVSLAKLSSGRTAARRCSRPAPTGRSPDRGRHRHLARLEGHLKAGGATRPSHSWIRSRTPSPARREGRHLACDRKRLGRGDRPARAPDPPPWLPHDREAPEESRPAGGPLRRHPKSLIDRHRGPTATVLGQHTGSAGGGGGCRHPPGNRRLPFKLGNGRTGPPGRERASRPPFGRGTPSERARKVPPTGPRATGLRPPRGSRLPLPNPRVASAGGPRTFVARAASGCRGLGPREKKLKIRGGRVGAPPHALTAHRHAYGGKKPADPGWQPSPPGISGSVDPSTTEVGEAPPPRPGHLPEGSLSGSGPGKGERPHNNAGPGPGRRRPGSAADGATAVTEPLLEPGGGPRPGRAPHRTSPPPFRHTPDTLANRSGAGNGTPPPRPTGRPSGLSGEARGKGPDASSPGCRPPRRTDSPKSQKSRPPERAPA